MSVTFTKLFSSITESTIWSEPNHTRLVWITMLAMSDRYGRVWGSVPGLAHRARVNLEECQAALQTLMSPDPHSRTRDHEGRRIETIEGGWRLLNHGKYLALRDEESRREQNREAQARRRGKSADVSKHADSQPASALVSHGQPPSAHADADADADADAEKASPRRASRDTPPGDAQPSAAQIVEAPKATKRSKPAGFDAAMIELPDWLDREDWQRWCADRAARKKPITEHGAAEQLKKLAMFRDEGTSPAAVISHSIAGGYQGLFAPASERPSKQAAIEQRNRAAAERFAAEEGKTE